MAFQANGKLLANLIAWFWQGESTTFRLAFNPNLSATEDPINRNIQDDNPRKRRGIVRIDTNDPNDERTRFQFLVEGHMTDPRLVMYAAQIQGELLQESPGPDDASFHISNMLFDYAPGAPSFPVLSERLETPIVDRISGCSLKWYKFWLRKHWVFIQRHVFVLQT